MRTEQVWYQDLISCIHQILHELSAAIPCWRGLQPVPHDPTVRLRGATSVSVNLSPPGTGVRCWTSSRWSTAAVSSSTVWPWWVRVTVLVTFWTKLCAGSISVKYSDWREERRVKQFTGETSHKLFSFLLPHLLNISLPHHTPSKSLGNYNYDL